MKLNVLKIKGLTHSGASKKVEPYSDGNGLFLIVHPSNTKTWQLRYTFQGKRGKIKIGTRPFPDTSLQLARDLASELRRNLAKGIDPKAKRKESVTFREVALEWWKDNQQPWGGDHTAKVKSWLEKDVFPIIGDLPPKDIDHSHIAEVVLSIEKAGHPSSAAPTLNIISRIFGRALVRKLTAINPAQAFPLRDVIKPLPKVKHRSAITDPRQLGKLMHDIENGMLERIRPFKPCT